jgi:DNA-binding transcriptional LysR family regulator
MHSSQREDRLTELETFVRVARAASFAAAADAMDLATPTLSRRVARLERSLGVRLLNRTTRNVSLTEAGSAYLEMAEDVLLRLADANAALSSLSAEPTGRLRLAVPTVFGQLHIAPTLAAFLAKHPAVKLDVSFSDAPIDLVAQRFDLAVRIGPLGSDDMPTRQLVAVRRVLCAAPALAASLGPIQDPHELGRLPTVHFSPLRTGAAWALQQGEDQVLVPIEPRMRTDNLMANLEAVKAGVGIGLIGTFLCAAELRTGGLVEVLPAWKPTPAWAWAIYPSNRHVPAKVRAMIDHLVHVFQPVPPWERPIA